MKASGVTISKEPIKALPSFGISCEPGFPIQVAQQQTAATYQLAPQPIADKFPVVVGPQLSFSYLASVARLCTTGYRQQAVDVWRELLEQDPHLASVLQKRILSVANGRVEIVAFDLPEDHPDYELAQEAQRIVAEEFQRIPALSTALASLLWAIYYGVAAAEIIWSKDANGWHIDSLEFVHTRRIAWPDMQSWDAYIWDQGQVYGWNSPWGSSQTNAGVFGLRIADFPGKFVLFAPQLFGDYPTRDGLARQTAMWSAFKRVPARQAIDYLERFSKGFIDVTVSTTTTGTPRAGTKEDIDYAKAVAQRLILAGGNSVAHPDSIKIEAKSFDGGAGAKLTWPDWIQLCNGEMSKLVLGGTLGTDVGKGGGNRALGEVQERGEQDLEKYDAASLGECLKRDLGMPLLRLRDPKLLRYAPSVNIHVDAEPDAGTVIANAEKLANMGAPVDADDVAGKTGFKLVPNESKDGKGKPKPRRLYKSDFIDPSLVDPNLKSEEAKQAEQDAADAEHELAKQKLAQPVAAPVAAANPANDAGKPAQKGKPAKKPAPAKGKASAAKADEKQAIATVKFLLSSKRSDAVPTLDVYESLLDDYPARALEWILPVFWEGPVEVPLVDIDFSERQTWRASHEDITPYVEKLEKALAGEIDRKPVILVKTPGNPLWQIVDGHHRTLASEARGVPVLAYRAHVPVENGPWEVLHGLQKKGSSKGSRFGRLASRFLNQEVTHDNEAAE